MHGLASGEDKCKCVCYGSTDFFCGCPNYYLAFYLKSNSKIKIIKKKALFLKISKTEELIENI